MSSLKDISQELRIAKAQFDCFEQGLTHQYCLLHAEYVTNGYVRWRFGDKARVLIRNQLHQLDHRCPVCHSSLSEVTATLDHLNPKSKYLGEALHRDNLLVMCRNCNAGKSSREFAHWYQRLPKTAKTRIQEAIIQVHGHIRWQQLVKGLV